MQDTQMFLYKIYPIGGQGQDEMGNTKFWWYVVGKRWTKLAACNIT